MQTKKTNLKEEDRLAAVISRIEEDALIIPRAAFIQQPTGEIVKNRLFEGKIKLENMSFNDFKIKVYSICLIRSISDRSGQIQQLPSLSTCQASREKVASF